jgi:signal transduction histidine kinase
MSAPARVAVESDPLPRIAEAARTIEATGHGVRGPLQTIRNLVFLAQKDPSQAQRCVALIGEQVALLALQMDGLAEPGLALRHPSCAEVEVASLVRRAVGGDDRVTLELCGESRSVQVDADQIVLAVRALIRNALEAAPAGSRVRVVVDQGPRELTLDVCDGGVWVPPEPLDRIYDPLYSTKGRTLGLGLPTALACVRGHDGTIEISCGRSGTTVRLRIPTPRPR